MPTKPRCPEGRPRTSLFPCTALPDFDATLAKDPDYPAALINRAVTCYELGEPIQSVRDLTRAMELAGEDPDLLLNRAIAHAACADLDAALADFDSALELPGADRPELLFHRGSCRLIADDRASGEADLRECRRLGGHADEVDALLAEA